MLFKTPLIQHEFTTTKVVNHQQRQLREYLFALDNLSLMLNQKEITMTDFLRDGSEQSLHHRIHGGRAADIRVRDKSTVWYVAMCEIGEALERLDHRFRMNPHRELYGKEQQHIHIEIRS